MIITLNLFNYKKPLSCHAEFISASTIKFVKECLNQQIITYLLLKIDNL